MATVIGALFLLVPLAGLVYSARRFRTDPRAWAFFAAGCVALIIPWLLSLLEKAGVWHLPLSPTNTFEKTVAALSSTLGVVGPAGAVLLVVAFVLKQSASPSTAPTPARLWPILTLVAAAAVAVVVIAIATPVDDATPSLVEGTVAKVDPQLATFVFTRNGLTADGIGTTYPLDNPMWVDHTGQKHLNSRPECLTTPLAQPARVELALLDIQGNPQAGFGNYRLLLSIRCLD
ncbi:hypothetical protein JOD54_004475 [Actinokineospora baliensis]|uniref:hypothetical protein n=1 Tax=Actinokineospora baliensis TaxID=547056 RepID=UPI0019574233|nr:hypothetical protein [Actinokineospora baliensis]MBM7774271.1 hypothetical protein [Actinokineospora baliensis]